MSDETHETGDGEAQPTTAGKIKAAAAKTADIART